MPYYIKRIIQKIQRVIFITYPQNTHNKIKCIKTRFSRKNNTNAVCLVKNNNDKHLYNHFRLFAIHDSPY